MNTIAEPFMKSTQRISATFKNDFLFQCEENYNEIDFELEDSNSASDFFQRKRYYAPGLDNDESYQ